MPPILFYLLLALGISFICSLLEAVLLSMTMTHVEVVNKNNTKVGSILKELKSNINRSIASIVTVNTFANTIGAVGVGSEAVKMFGEEYMFFVSTGLTIMILFIAEIIPKTIGANNWKSLATPAAYIIRFFIFITYPLLLISEFLTKLLKADKNTNSGVTREELLANAQISEDAGNIREQESDVIENILNLSTLKVEDILTPRSVVFALPKDLSIEEALKIDDLRNFSRIPIYDENMDNVIGMVRSKRIFERAIETRNVPLVKFLRPMFSIHENIPVSKAMDLFLKRREHIFLVTDSYGQTAGIVTLEDCIETLLGVEIIDEVDKAEDMQELAKQKMKEKRQSQG